MNNALVWFSPISILLGLAISVLQLYVTSKQAKLKETIKDEFRHELEEAVEKAKKEMREHSDWQVRLMKAELINELRK